MPTLLNKNVGPHGFGLMGFTWRPVQTPDEQAFAAMKAALEKGANFWNGGEFYGPPDSNSLQLLNRYFTKYPEDAEKVLLSIKGSMFDMVPRGDEASVRSSVENCIKLLDGKKKIDIFECARVDKNTPIEETIGALAKLVKEGKIGGIALSEVNAETVKRAAKVHPIAAVEVEVSLWENNALENGVLKTCGELNIPIVAYSPVGRGFLTGQVRSIEDLPEGDMRRRYPRFSPENFPQNLEIVEKLRAIAETKGVTPAQLALAWVRQLSDRPEFGLVIPIPGTTSAERVNENMDIKVLSDADLAEIDKVLSSLPAAGARAPEGALAMMNG